jgi:hypothetical protein
LKVYVVDASVPARFLLFEELSEKADLLLQKFHEDAIELKALGLVNYEVGNAALAVLTFGLDLNERLKWL